MRLQQSTLKKKTNYPQQDEEVFGPVANWVSSVAKIPWKAARLFAERWGWGRQRGGRSTIAIAIQKVPPAHRKETRVWKIINVHIV